MTPNEIQIGTRLELELSDKNGEKSGNIYISQLLEQLEDNCAVISAPIFEARLIFIPLQAQLRLTFLHHKHGLLGFSAHVTGREFRGNIAVLIIQIDSELIKVQRRTHYRLDYIAAAVIRPIEKDSKAGNKTEIKAVAKNISGSGVCLVTDVDLPKDSEAEVELTLVGNARIVAKCKIVRNTAFEIKKVKNYELGMHFTNISPKDQDNLIKYIFEQQRVLLKKEVK